MTEIFTKINKDVWIDLIVPKLSVLDVVRLRSVCSYFRNKLKDPAIYWRKSIDFSKGSDDWNVVLCKASQVGDWDLVNLFISKGANDWDAALTHVYYGKEPKVSMITFFREKIFDDYGY